MKCFLKVLYMIGDIGLIVGKVGRIIENTGRETGQARETPIRSGTIETIDADKPAGIEVIPTTRRHQSATAVPVPAPACVQGREITCKPLAIHIIMFSATG